MSLDLTIQARPRDIGGFSVRRILPYATHRMVGPFIFFDHMGPANFEPGHGIDVRPHPHINLSTVTYLFEGAIFHRDSLGSAQLIEPGAINWMTAGHGIVHSERTPADLRARGGRLNGIQCWVALPEEMEEITPAFTHHPANTLPEFEVNGARLKLLLGSAFGHTSPVRTHSDIVYLEARIPAGAGLTVASDKRELAVYLVTGSLQAAGEQLAEQTMAVSKSGEDLELKANADSHAMILGGAPLGPRFIWWNFVSSSEERLERAKKDWAEGRFPKVPGDDKEFIPLPNDPPPRGTPM